MKTLKILTGIFSVAVAGIVLSLGMTIYTGVKMAQEKNNPAPLTIPTPAMQNS